MMGLYLGLAIAVLTLPATCIAAMQGSGWEAVSGARPYRGLAALAIGLAAAGALIYSSHPIGW